MKLKSLLLILKQNILLLKELTFVLILEFIYYHFYLKIH